MSSDFRPFDEQARDAAAAEDQAGKRHLLHMTVTDEGYIEVVTSCPYDPPTAKMPCCGRDRAGEPVDPPECVVGEWVEEVGMEAFKGSVAVPPIPIRWWWDGWGEDAEFWFEAEQDLRLAEDAKRLAELAADADVPADAREFLAGLARKLAGRTP